MTVSVRPRVQEALERGRPVVALESTVVTHGLPHPRNLELARALEADVRAGGAEPATIGIVRGEIVVGLDDEELTALAGGELTPDKASLWNVAAIVARGASAGTTVATTLLVAARCGIRVFATGGIGGVHPAGPNETSASFDESSDLTALARYPLVTVCAGPKSVLDVPATLERLETLGVTVAGYRTGRLAGFHVPESDLDVPARLDSPGDVAKAYLTSLALGLPGALLLCRPVSEGLEREELQGYLDTALEEAAARRGKDVTPFLLQRLFELSGGRTVDVNVRLLRENASLAAEVAVAISRLRTPEPTATYA